MGRWRNRRPSKGGESSSTFGEASDGKTLPLSAGVMSDDDVFADLDINKKERRKLDSSNPDDAAKIEKRRKRRSKKKSSPVVNEPRAGSYKPPSTALDPPASILRPSSIRTEMENIINPEEDGNISPQDTLVSTENQDRYKTDVEDEVGVDTVDADEDEEPADKKDDNHRDLKQDPSVSYSVGSRSTFDDGSYTQDGSRRDPSVSSNQGRSFKRRQDRYPGNHRPMTKSSFDSSVGVSTVASDGRTLDTFLRDVDSDYYYVRQKYGYLSIGVSTAQLATLAVMMALCGVAPLDVNPMVGPYPDAISEWGGKNTYLILEDFEIWRYVSSALLNTGVIHLLCNVAVQLETGAFFEREWGSFRWFLIYVSSAVGAVLTGCIFDPNHVSVASSGAIMGLFGAKISEVLALSLFDTRRRGGGGNSTVGAGDAVRLEQVSGVLCSVAIVSLFSFIPYVDWSGHMGGLAVGFAVGTFLFSSILKHICWLLLWGLIGLGLVAASLGYGFYYLYTEVEADEELGDPCEYFRRLFSEGYECECFFI